METYIRVVDVLIERLKKHKLDNNRFHDFVQRVRAMLEKYADKDQDNERAFASIDLPDNELEDTFDVDDLPNEDEEEANRSVLEQLKKRLSELRDKLKQNGRNFRVRVVESYLKVVDALIERLKKHELDNGRFNDFVKRAREMLEKYAKSKSDH